MHGHEGFERFEGFSRLPRVRWHSRWIVNLRGAALLPDRQRYQSGTVPYGRPPGRSRAARRPRPGVPPP